MSEKNLEQSPAGLWDPVDLETGKCYYWQLGSLDVWIKHKEDEWAIAAQTGDDLEFDEPVAKGESVDEPEDLEWERWMLKEGHAHVQMTPLMPDRPLVVRPSAQIHIPPGQKARFYISLPLWIRFDAFDAKPITLCEKPGIILSNTWFGDPVSGELCYALNTKARRELDDLTVRPYRALCPVTIKNAHNEMFDFERICLRTEYLGVFKGKTRLLTNEVQVTFQGPDQQSKLKYSKKPPSIEPVEKKLSDPRKTESSLIRTSFNSLISHSIYG